MEDAWAEKTKETQVLQTVVDDPEQGHVDRPSVGEVSNNIGSHRRRQSLRTAWEKFLGIADRTWSWKLYAAICVLIFMLTCCVVIYSYGYPFRLMTSEDSNGINALPEVKSGRYIDTGLENTSSSKQRQDLLDDSVQKAASTNLLVDKMKYVEHKHPESPETSNLVSNFRRRHKCASVIINDEGIAPKYCDSLSLYEHARNLTVKSLGAYHSLGDILHLYKRVEVLALEFDNFCPGEIEVNSEEGATMFLNYLVELRVSNRNNCDDIGNVFDMKMKQLQRMYLSNLTLTEALHKRIVEFLEEPCRESSGGQFTKISIVNYTKCERCDIGWRECNTLMDKYFEIAA